MPIDEKLIEHLPKIEAERGDLLKPVELAEFKVKGHYLPHYIAGIVEDYRGSGKNFLAMSVDREEDGRIQISLRTPGSFEEYRQMYVFEKSQIDEENPE